MSKRICPYFGIAAIMGTLFVFMLLVLTLPVLAQDEMTTAESTGSSSGDPGVVDNFSKAVEVEESSSVEGVLAAGEADYFKMPLNAGYQVKIFGSANKDGDPVANSLEITLYQEGGNVLSTNDAFSDGTATAEAFYYKGITAANTTDPEMVYIQVKNRPVMEMYDKPINYKVGFERIDRSDASANTDAGYDFETALDLQLTNNEGSFDKNFLGVNKCGVYGEYCSTDEVDYYMLSLKAGDALNFEVTPGAEMSVELNLYDENRSKEETEGSSNAGAITSLEYTAQESQNVYVAVSSDDFSSYAMEVAVVEGAAVTTSPTASPTTTPATTPASTVTAETTPTTADEKGFNIWDYKWYLIGGGGAIIVVIIIVIVMSRGKKKTGIPQQTEVDQLRAKMRGGSAAGTTGVAGATASKIGPTRTMHSDMRNVPAAPAKPGFPKTAAPAKPSLPKTPPPPVRPSTGGLPKTPPSPATPPPRPVGSPPSGLPKAPSKGPVPSGPKRVPEPPKPVGPPAPPKPVGQPSPPKPVGSTPSPQLPTPASPKTPTSPKSSPPTAPGQSRKPGEMTNKAKQDIDDIFGG